MKVGDFYVWWLWALAGAKNSTDRTSIAALTLHRSRYTLSKKDETHTFDDAYEAKDCWQRIRNKWLTEPLQFIIGAGNLLQGDLCKGRIPLSEHEKMIAFDLQSTPFGKSEVITTPIWRKSSKETISAYAIIKRDDLLPFLQGTQFQHDVTRLVLENGSNPSWLKPPQIKAARLSWLTPILITLLVLAVNITAFSFWKHHSDQFKILEARVASETKQALDIRAKHAANAKLNVSSEKVGKFASEKRPLSLIWATLANELPDTAYLSMLRLKDSKVEIVGAANSASKLVQDLQKNTFFESVRFLSPTQKLVESEKERFIVEFMR